MSFIFLLPFLSSYTEASLKSGRPLRVLVDFPPHTLNPRYAIQDTSQKIGALLFSGLTRMNADLNIEGDLASRWRVSPDGKKWSFDIQPHARDHLDQPITPQDVLQCVESYLKGTPRSPLGDLSKVLKVDASQTTITFFLRSPEPYLGRLLSRIRFFRSDQGTCVDPDPQGFLVGSGPFSLAEKKIFQLTPKKDLQLIPVNPELTSLHFFFVSDANTRFLYILKGKADAVLNDLPMSKVRWLEKNHPDRFHVFERDGVNLSYLAFQLRHPILKDKNVRIAIAMSLPRKEIIQRKMYGAGTLARGFLISELKESYSQDFPFAPKEAEKLLDAAGYPRKSNGIRFQLKYKTTPVREGIEQARIFKESLEKIGIEILLEVIDPATFFSSLKNGNFDLFSSRWLNVLDGSFFETGFHSKGKRNRVFYENSEIDSALEKMTNEPSENRRIHLLHSAQKRMLEELPYFPLWHWNNALIVEKSWKGISSTELSRAGDYFPLSRLKQP